MEREIERRKVAERENKKMKERGSIGQMRVLHRGRERERERDRERVRDVQI